MSAEAIKGKLFQQTKEPFQRTRDINWKEIRVPDPAEVKTLLSALQARVYLPSQEDLSQFAELGVAVFLPEDQEGDQVNTVSLVTPDRTRMVTVPVVGMDLFKIRVGASENGRFIDEVTAQIAGRIFPHRCGPFGMLEIIYPESAEQLGIMGAERVFTETFLHREVSFKQEFGVISKPLYIQDLHDEVNLGSVQDGFNSRLLRATDIGEPDEFERRNAIVLHLSDGHALVFSSAPKASI